jgi:hypothetical protein
MRSDHHHTIDLLTSSITAKDSCGSRARKEQQ